MGNPPNSKSTPSKRRRKKERQRKHLSFPPLFLSLLNMISVANVDSQKGKDDRVRFSLKGLISTVKEMGSKRDTRKIMHSMKVGLALVLVSLVYMIKPMFNQVGTNGMWAIMTVVVMFDFYAGEFSTSDFFFFFFSNLCK